MQTHNGRHDPVEALKRIRGEMKGSHERYHNQVASVYHQARQIAGNPMHLANFQKDPFWNGLGFPNCILRAAMRFVWDARETNTGDYKAAVFASAALQYYFNDGVRVEEMYDLIKRSGGIEPLSREQPPHSGESRLDTGSLPGPVDQPGDNDSLDQRRPTQAKKAVQGPTARSKAGGGEGRVGPRQFSRAWCEERLVLDTDQLDLVRILSVPQGAKGNISFVAEGPDKSGFLGFRVVAVSIGKFKSAR